MNILFLRGFNNYFNRIVKTCATLEEYQNNSQSYLNYGNINFNPNDGVATELIVGNTDQKENSTPLDWESIGTPDYAVCYEMENDAPIIKFRWFVLESERTRLGQYRLALKRDVIADNLTEVKDSTCFIEKAIIEDVENPLIYNNEDMTYNQIKVSELLLKDESESAWVVAYFPKDFNGGRVDATIPYSGGQDYSVNGIASWEFYDYVSNPYKYHIPTQLVINHQAAHEYEWSRGGYSGVANQSRFGTVTWNKDSNSFYTQTGYSLLPPTGFVGFTGNVVKMSGETAANLINTTNKNSFDSEVRIFMSENGSSWGYNFISASDESRLLATNNKVILDSSTNKFYKISVYYGDEVSGVEIGENNVARPTLSTTNVRFNNVWQTYSTKNLATSGSISGTTNTVPGFDGYFKSKRMYVVITEMVNSIHTTIPAPTGRYHLVDSPYDMLCIPYGDNISIYSNATLRCVANKISAINIATAIGEKQGDGAVYDVQLLPYCPIRQIIAGAGRIDYASLFHSDILDANNNVVNVAFYCSVSEFSFDINKNIRMSGDPTSPIDLKIENETMLYRLASPNWAGQFDFSLAKLGGTLTGFHVDCNYRPFQPYIHIVPHLKGLYGRAIFNDTYDARGLVCGGEFSLPQLSNAWANYTLQNKNYQAIFDRQMLNLDRNNAIAMEQAKLNAGLGSISGGLSGFAGGAIAGSKAGPWGAVAGAAVGLVAGTAGSIYGGMKDIEWLDRQQQEAKSYATDMYGYQLGNIQAIPTSLSKISSYTLNNKIWPVLEIYSATNKEKEALRNKINYDGMTVMAIDKIYNYDSGFLRGELIRINIGDDFHIADAIYQEIKKGLYFNY